jgi:hypothetical protein
MAPHLRSSLNISDLTDEQLVAVFEAFSKKHDKGGLIGADDIRPLLIQAYGREPPEIEVREFLRLIEADGSLLPPVAGLQARGRYVNAQQFAVIVASVRAAMSGINPRAATEFTSNNEFRATIGKNTSVQYGPHEKYRTPVTTSQEYGWHTQLPHERVPRHPMKSCDVTAYQSEMIKSGHF